MDSIEITIQRTGAATAVAARHLARADSKIATICGCGNQGHISLRALSRVLPVEQVFAYDSDETQVQRFTSELAQELQINVRPVGRLEDAVGQSDIVITCTPSRQPFLKREFVTPGTFIAAVGADTSEQQEIDPSLMNGNKIVVDILEQCAVIGELHHALDVGVITKSDIHAELGEVVAGVKPGRTSAQDVIIFDSTGMALQDVVAAAAVYEKALELGKGRRM